MTDDDVLVNLGTQRKAAAKAQHRHRWDQFDPHRGILCRCGAVKDDAATRKGRNARSRGNRRELYVQRTYGPRKTGQFQDAIDNLGRSWKWQSKTTSLGHWRHVPLWAATLDTWWPIKSHRWITDPIEHMDPLYPDRYPLLIRSWTFPGGSLDIIIVRSSDWAALHGPPAPGTEYMAMTGRYFLNINGTDEETRS